MSMHNGRVALVTGATRGIGKAIALKLGAQGATVCGTATSEAGAAKITEYLAQAGIQGKGYVANVADTDSVTALFAAMAEDFDAPVIVVNNAGITKDNLMLRMKEADWDAVINTNLTSIFRVSKAALRAMSKNRWGRIVNISSVVGSMGNAGQANYSASKAGAEGFGRSLAREVAPRGITVNSVAPGFIDTDMTDVLEASHKEALLAQVPSGRLGDPAEIASAVAFLASDEAAYITGETIHVNGGMYM